MNPYGVTGPSATPADFAAYNAGIRAARMANDEVAADFAQPGCILCLRPYDPAVKSWRRLRPEPGDLDTYLLCCFCLHAIRKEARESAMA